MTKQLPLVLLVIILFSSGVHGQQPSEHTQPGLSIRVYEIGHQMDKLRALVPGQTPNVSRIVDSLDYRGEDGPFEGYEDHFLIIADGFLIIDKPGQYGFELASDDGAALFLNGRKIIDNDFEHATEVKRVDVELKKGMHEILVRYFQSTGGKDLWLSWRPPGETDFEVIPSTALRAPAGEVRVTSPGRKQLIESLGRGRPGDLQPLTGVHPSYDLVSVRPKNLTPKVGGIDWLSDGRMVMCTWDPDGAVYLLDGVTADDPQNISFKKIASGLAEPLGLSVVDDRIFVLQKQELTELSDTNGDDIIDDYWTTCSGWPVSANFHEFAFGLVPDGRDFIATLAIAIDPGGRSTQPQAPDRGTAVRLQRNGNYKVVAEGLRTPNGLGRGPGQNIYIADNQGDWVPVSKIVKLEDGAFYGSQAVLGEAAANREVSPPVVWLPQGEIGNSPTEIILLPNGPYAGQMAHGDVTHGGLKRVFIEQIDDVEQGAVFRFTQGLEGGSNRVSVGPDGGIYVGGIGSTGNWGQEDKKWYGLDRLRSNDTIAFEMLAVRAMSNGLELEFTEPIAEFVGDSPQHYVATQYRYEPTEEYGGPKIDERLLPIKSANVSEDRRKVFIELDEMEAGSVIHVRLIGPWKSNDDKEPWTTEAWYTMNKIPEGRSGHVQANNTGDTMNQLTEREQAEGWELLFDGRTAKGWRGYQSKEMPGGWTVEDGALVLTGSGGDIVTKKVFGNFELSVDWMVEPGGNSGIFYRGQETEPAIYFTAPEMQVLDNQRHTDGENPLTSAGSAYGLYAPQWDHSYPAGAWNRARIVVQDGNVEHWLNGEKLLAFDMKSEEFANRKANSKFKDWSNFAVADEGHIALQDHGDRVAYRNIKIRPLPAN